MLLWLLDFLGLLGAMGALVLGRSAAIDLPWCQGSHWRALGFGGRWADGKLEGTTFYIDRLSPIATMQVIPTFPRSPVLPS
jgi:hypothetical protein